MFLNLNPAQQVAADSVHGDFVVIAGPGSGKTSTLIQRYLLMVTKYGISPTDILNLTFTNAAACEMVERIGLLDAKQNFRTFHSFALDVAKRERDHFPFKLIDTVIPCRGEQVMLIKKLLKIYPGIPSYSVFSEKLSEWKCSNITPDEALETSDGENYWMAHGYRDYEKKSREEGWLDFDSLMKEVVALFEVNEDVRNRNKRKFLTVDECQDTDVIQFKLLKLLYAGNIFVVGDENQLIYEWRSAQSGNLTNFTRTFPGSRTLYLGQNYRSTKKLVDFFKRILPVDNGIGSHMVSERPDGSSPTVTEYISEREEVYQVLQRIQQLNDLPNTAILARTNRQLQMFQRVCLNSNIQSRILGKKNVWEENEVKELLLLGAEYPNQDAPAASTMKMLMESHNLLAKYQSTSSGMDKDPIQNLMDIIKMAGRRGSLKEFSTWLRKLTYGSKSKKMLKPMLTLATVHQAKGREWKHVFVVGVNEGLMPHKEGELVEEKRIFFVACSRAADTLNISYFGKRSHFLNNMEDLDNVYAVY